MNANTNKNKIISTSFTFKEIVNMIPIIFDFKLSGSQGFPSNLETGTISGTSYVMPKGLSDNVSELHEYLSVKRITSQQALLILSEIRYRLIQVCIRMAQQV